jgi:phage baseplate assembly protein V
MGLLSEAEEIARDAAGSALRLAEGMIRRAVISRLDDAKSLAQALVRLLDDEPEPAEVWQEYGFTSRPPEGAEAIVLRVGGVPEHQIVVRTALRGSRPKLNAEGDVKIWHLKGQVITVEDNQITLKINRATGAAIDLGGGATKSVNYEGNSVEQGAAMKVWMDAVTAAIPVTPLAGTVIGATGAGSSVVKTLT